MTMKKMIEDFLDDLLLAQGRTQRTIDVYRRNLHQLQRFAEQQGWSTMREALEPHALRRFLAHLQQEELKANSIKQKIATLRSLATFLRRAHPDQAPTNQQLHLRYRSERRVVRTLTSQQLQEMLQYLGDRADAHPEPGGPDPRHPALLAARDLALFSVMAGTGIRVGETVALRLKDVDLDRGQINIQGKGGHHRIVFCDIPEIQLSLRSYLKRRLLLSNVEADLLFLNGRDLKAISPRAVQLRLKATGRELQLPEELTPHLLRHTYATLAIERGANIKAVSQLLGHADVKTTLQLYTHLSTEHLNEVFRLCHPFRDNRLELPEIINNRKKMIPYLR
jgi:site-specific recombinase XerD